VCPELRDPAVAMKTLVLIPVVHEGGDECPFFGILIVKLYEMLVLIRCPGFNFAFFRVEVFLLDFEVDFDAVKALDRFAKLS
jgi:hypothetical protein